MPRAPRAVQGPGRVPARRRAAAQRGRQGAAPRARGAGRTRPADGRCEGQAEGRSRDGRAGGSPSSGVGVGDAVADPRQAVGAGRHRRFPAAHDGFDASSRPATVPSTSTVEVFVGDRVDALVAEELGVEVAQRIAHRVELARRLDPRHLGAGAAFVPVGPELELFGLSAAGVGVIELFEVHRRHCGASRATVRRMASDRSLRPGPARPGQPAQPDHQGRDLRGAHAPARRHARAHRIPPPVRGRGRRHDDGRVLRDHPGRHAPTAIRSCSTTPTSAPGCATLTDAVHAEGAAIAAQIGHAGPVANPMGTKSPALAPSRVFSPLGMRRTQAVTASEIATIVEQYAHGAARAPRRGLRRDRGAHRARLPVERVPVAQA